MHKRTIGTTDLQVGELALGTAPLGGLRHAVTDDSAAEVVEAAWSCGIRMFDTAPFYGAGLAERRLGRVLTRHPRHEYVVSTKVGRLVTAGEQGAPGTVMNFGYDATLASLEQSLERLGLDSVEVALVHDPVDRLDEAIDGAFRALVRLREEGVVRAIGAGVNSWQLAAACVRAIPLDCVMPAGRLSLLDSSSMAELVPLCSERGVSILAAGVFSSGVLADPRPGALFDYRPASAEVLGRARMIENACREFGVELSTTALRFPLLLPQVATVVFGAHPATEVIDNVRAFAEPVPAELWRTLVELGVLPEEAITAARS